MTDAGGTFVANVTFSGATTHTGAATFNGGVGCGSVIASSIVDLSKHLALLGTTYGANVTNNTLNLVSNGNATMQLTNTGATVNGTVTTAGAITITSGGLTAQSGNITAGPGNSLIADGPNTLNRQVAWTTSGSARWLAIANSTTESGANVGSDFQIVPFQDNGTISPAGAALTIKRSSAGDV